MLQKFIENNSVDKLLEYGIDITYHPTLPLAILNYNQIKSIPYKTHPLIVQSRGTVIDLEGKRIVGRGFDRFFNLGEVETEFNWGDFTCEEKVDGSFILMYDYGGPRFNTRSTFAEGLMPYGPLTWAQVISRNINPYFLPAHSFVFELVGPLNKVVRDYPEGLYLLYGRSPQGELGRADLDKLALNFGVRRPNMYCVGRDELTGFLEAQENTFEGVVLYDGTTRIKLKKKTYLELSRIKNNGYIASKRGFIEFYIKGDTDELCTYFVEFKPLFDEYKTKLDNLMDSIDLHNLGLSHLGQKDYALLTKDKVWSGLAFESRRKGCSVRECLSGKHNILEKLI